MSASGWLIGDGVAEAHLVAQGANLKDLAIALQVRPQVLLTLLCDHTPDLAPASGITARLSDAAIEHLLAACDVPFVALPGDGAAKSPEPEQD